MAERAVLALAYGTPRSLDDVERYYTDIRGGRRPAPEALEELTSRYRAIGGRSPLLEITEAQARGIAARLGVPVFVGQKHSPPTIPDAVAKLRAEGVSEAVGLVLAPHYSRLSVGDYERRVRDAAAAAGWEGRLMIVRSWHREPGYISLLTRRVHDALGTLPAQARPGAVTVFTAHSLPQRIVAEGDPYPAQLEETARLVAAAAGLGHWRTGWQSAGRTAEAWLGPDILDIVRDLARRDVPGVVVCPCGFVADHLEILYDLDIEASRLAGELGIVFARTASPNDDPALLDTLAEVCARAFAEASVGP